MVLPYLFDYNNVKYVAILRYLMVFALPYLIKRHVEILRQEDYVDHFQQINYGDNRTYDFIIVGASPSGSVLANRLSAPPNNYNVLLLEAGGDPIWSEYYPGFDIFCPNSPGIDWEYFSVPQRNCCLSCKGGRLGSWRGLGLGGTGAINFLIYNRGNPKVFDNWAERTGDKSWSYDSVLSYFKKSENYSGNYPNPAFHGCGGEFPVGKISHLPGLEYFLPAIRENGYVEQDINQNQTLSFMRMDINSLDGIRSNGYFGFLKPILGRKNLHIHRYSFATKILFDPLNPTRAIGVEYYRHNKIKFAFATKEVIVSAGAYNSPKLLMLSGIGPKGDLTELGIPVLKDLPVGKRLQDHPTTLFAVIFNKSYSSEVVERDAINGVLIESLYPRRYTQGFFDGNNLFGTGFFSTKYNEDVSFPDVEAYMMYLGLSHVTPIIWSKLLNTHDELFASLIESYEGMDGNMALVSLMRTQSYGYVALNGTNPFNPPIIDTNLFSDPDNMDIKRLVEGMKLMVEFYENSTTYQSIGARLLPVPWPGCEKFVFKSLEYYECYIRHLTFTLWHAAGTCKMGRADDPMAVVDTRLRVLGIQNVRVVDTSIMPRITNGNTNAPALMIGEKAADMIIRDNGGFTVFPGSQAPCPIPIHLRDEF